MTYAEALRELETILAEIEDERTDIDVLTDRVTRAAELIQACKHKLRTAEEAVGQVLRQLDSGTE